MINILKWDESRVLVTGGSGFLGSWLVQALNRRGCADIFVARSVDYDLRDQAAVRRLYEESRPQIVFHLAATVGGIGANQASPGRFLYDNALMGLEMIDKARLFGVDKFVCVGTVCSYPKFAPVPFKESGFWEGFPEETNAPYGLAKKLLLVQLQAYRKQYRLKGIYPVLANLYGPGDSFDPDVSHVIPALVRKCVDAKMQGASSIQVWGSGRASREFLYVKDAAEALVRAAESYEQEEPLNIGSGIECRIAELVDLIKDIVGFAGDVVWDATKPDGQPRRWLDTSRAQKLLEWKAQTSLRQGLEETVRWYLAQAELLTAGK